LDRSDSGIQTTIRQFAFAKILVKEPPELIVNIKSKTQHSTGQSMELLLSVYADLTLYFNRHRNSSSTFCSTRQDHSSLIFKNIQNPSSYDFTHDDFTTIITFSGPIYVNVTWSHPSSPLQRRWDV